MPNSMASVLQPQDVMQMDFRTPGDVTNAANSPA
jgi:hypothetical protein